MFTACQHCAARYSLPDEKIRGLKVRIKCRRCGQLMIIDGTPLGPPPSRGSGGGEKPSGASDAKAPAHRVVVVKPPIPPRLPPRHVPSIRGTRVGGLIAPASDVERWHVVVAGETKELVVAAIAECFRRGDIDAETYVWRDGMGDWASLHATELVATLVRLGIPVVKPEPSPIELASAAIEDEMTQVAGTAAHVQASPLLASAPDDVDDADDATRIYSSEPTTLGDGVPAADAPAGSARGGASEGDVDEATRIHSVPGSGASEDHVDEKPGDAPQGTTTPRASGRSESTRPAPPPRATAWQGQDDEAAVIVRERTAPRRAAAVRPEAEGRTSAHPPAAQREPPRAQGVRSPHLVGGAVLVAGLVGFVFAEVVPRLRTPAVAAPAETVIVVDALEPPAASLAAPRLAPPASAAPESSAAPPEASLHRSSSAPSVRVAGSPPASRAPATRVEAAAAAPAVAPSPPEAAPRPSAVTAPAAAAAEPSATTAGAPVPAAPAPHLGPFDPAAASAALGAAARRAEAACAKPDQPNGSALVTLSFVGTGHAVGVAVRGALSGTPTGLCILRIFNGVTIPAFDGDGVSRTQSLTIP